MTTDGASSASAFEAYRTETVVDNFPRTIASLCLWGEQVLVGLQDGSVLFFQRNAAAAVGQAGAWQVAKAHRDVEKKSVAQMVCVTLTPAPGTGSVPKRPSSGGVSAPPAASDNAPVHRPFLLSLTEDGVNVRSLPDGMLRYQAVTSKGATCMSWSGARKQLAAAVRRRVLLFALRPRERPGGGQGTGVTLDQLLDVAAPDTLVTMAWAGDTLFVASKKGYHALAASPVANHTGMAGCSNGDAPAAAAPAPTLSALVAGEVCSVGSAINPSISLTLTGGEVLLARDNQLVCLDYKAQSTRKQPITFSEPIISVGVGQYHVVALLPSGVEIRSLRRTSGPHVAQRVPSLIDARLVAVPGAASDGSLYLGMAGDKGVRRLVPVSLAEQAEQLAREGEYEDALALAALLDTETPTSAATTSTGSTTVAPVSPSRPDTPTGPDEPQPTFEGSESTTAVVAPQHRRAVEDRLRIMYAQHLFEGGEYDSGMSQLALCSACDTPQRSVLVLLRMLPALVPKRLQHWLPDTIAGVKLAPVTESSGPQFASAASYALPYLTSYRSRLMSAHPDLLERRLAWETQRTATATSTQAGTTAQLAAQGSEAPTTPRASEAAPVTAPTDAQHSPGAQSAQARTVQGPKQQSNQQSDQTSDQQPPRSEISSDHTDGGSPGLELILTMIDTAMVAAMLAQKEDTGSLLRFVQQSPNWVDLEEGRRMLHAAGRYAELAALYKYHGKHDKALDVLHACSQSHSSLDPPATGAAADLSGLPGVWAAVRYLSHLGSEQADLIRQHSGWILSQDPEAGLQAFLQMRQPLEPSLALDILHTHSPSYASMYLESALEMGVAAPQDYHSELLLLYLQEFLDRSDNGSTEEEDAATTTGASPHIHADANTPGTTQPGTGQQALLSPVPGFRPGTSPVSPELDHMRMRRRAKHARDAQAAAAPAGSATPPAAAGSVAESGSAAAKSRKRRRIRSDIVSQDVAGFNPLSGVTAGPWPLFPDNTLPSLKTHTLPLSGGARQHKHAASTASQGSHKKSTASPTHTHPHRPKGTSSPSTPTPPTSDTDSHTDTHTDIHTTTAGGRDTSPLSSPPSTPPRRVANGRGAAGSTTAAAAADFERVMDTLWEAPPTPDSGKAIKRTKGKKNRTKVATPVKDVVAGASKAPAAAQPDSGAGAAAAAQAAAAQEPAPADAADAAAVAPAKPARRPLYQRLRELVFSSPYLDPQHVLSKLPHGELPEIRALMLERLGRHLEALRLYCHVLEDIPLAEAYCDRVYTKECESRRQGHSGPSQPTSADTGSGSLVTRTSVTPSPAQQGITTGAHRVSTGGVSSMGGAGELLVGQDTPREILHEPGDIYLMLLQVALESTSVKAALQRCIAQRRSAKDEATTGPESTGPGSFVHTFSAPPTVNDQSTAALLEGAGAPELWQQAMWALGRNVSRVDPQRLLAAVPPDMPLPWVLPLMQAALGWAADSQRTAEVTRQLRRSENLMLREMVGSERAARVVLTLERACAICYRRIGLSAFVAYPDLSLAHYQCHKRKYPNDKTCVLQPAAPTHSHTPSVTAVHVRRDSSTPSLAEKEREDAASKGPPPLPVSLPAGRGDSTVDARGSGGTAMVKLQPATARAGAAGARPGGASGQAQTTAPSAPALAIPPSLLD